MEVKQALLDPGNPLIVSTAPFVSIRASSAKAILWPRILRCSNFAHHEPSFITSLQLAAAELGVIHKPCGHGVVEWDLL